MANTPIKIFRIPNSAIRIRNNPQSAEEFKAYEIAEAYALLNFKDQALTYLSKACDKPINYNLVFLKVNPIFDPIRDDPRFAKLLVRLGLSE